MRRLGDVAVVLVVVVFGVMGPDRVAAQRAMQRNEPGQPTVGEVRVLNRTAADAIAVTLQGIATPLPIAASRQAWEYRQVLVPATQDASAALNAAGLEGWEAFQAAAGAGGTIWTLKRPK